MSPVSVSSIGEYIRQQREQAKISLRQLASAAGVSNPYLSQIERGLRRPSAEILQQIAKGLQVSAESLYVRAGILDERVADGDPAAAPDVLSAIAADPAQVTRFLGVLTGVVPPADFFTPANLHRLVGIPGVLRMLTARSSHQAHPA